MIKYLIIDDEPIAHDIIKGYCDMLPNLEFKADCYDAIEALNYLQKHEVDLIFLDLNMPKLKGFEFLKTLSSPPKVIVTTAYSEFAIEGYELNVVDYLLKPFSFERFLSAVNKVKTPNQEINTQVITSNETKNERLFLKDSKKHYQVKLNDILYLEAYGNYVKVFLKDNTIITNQTLNHFIKLLSKEDFVQVHKSYIVAIQHIDLIEGNIVHIDKHKIPISKTYKLNINQLLKG